MSKFQNFDFTSDFEQQSAVNNTHNELIVMMQKHQSEMDNHFKARKNKWANFFNNYRTSTIISNNAHQEQRH